MSEMGGEYMVRLGSRRYSAKRRCQKEETLRVISIPGGEK